MKQFYCILVVCFSVLIVKAQTAPPIQRQISMGGSGVDMAQQMRSTKDKGFIIAGYSSSTDANVRGNHGGDDYWIIKLDNEFKKQWQRSLGGSGVDDAQDIQQTPDSGYVVIGSSTSDDGNVTNHHNGSIFVNWDYWVVKMDKDGKIQWQKSLGGTGDDFGESVVCTNDKGYVVAGWSNSLDGDVTGNHGGNDYWVVKLDSTGNIIWQKSLGGSGSDIAFSINNTSANGYVVAGGSASNDGDVTTNQGDYDFWIVLLNNNGKIVSQKSFGGGSEDIAFSVQQTADNGLVVAGRSASNNGDLNNNNGSLDEWIIKLRSNLSLQWQHNYGGTNDEEAHAVKQTKDSGYIVAGFSYSQNGDVTGNHGEPGNPDAWILKLNSRGQLDWEKCAGGSGAEYDNSILQTKDGGYISAASSNSTDGDVTGNHGDYDYWIIKLASTSTTQNIAIKQATDNSAFSQTDNNIQVTVSPNPFTSFIRIQSNTSLYNAGVSIYDMNGKLFYNNTINITGIVDLPGGNLPRGNYILNISTTTGVRKSFTVIKK